jgi:hypothetical protein
MKPITFLGSINNESDILIAESKKDYLTVRDDFSLRIDNEFYDIESIKEEERQFKFNIARKHDEEAYLMIPNLSEKKIYKKDFLEIILTEYDAERVPRIVDKGKGYKKGEKLLFEGFEGVFTLSINEVNKEGSIVSVDIETNKSFLSPGYKEITPSGGSGKGHKLIVEMKDNGKRMVTGKYVRESLFDKRANYINFEYNLPDFIEKGEIKIYRTEIKLGKKYEGNNLESVICIAQKADYTEKFGIPIAERGTINAYKLYNQGAQIIEDKITELESRIIELESRF